MSAVPLSKLPRLDSDLDSSVLARPERRQGTARLRREYTVLRDDNFQDDKRLIRERAKFAEQLKLLKALKLLAERDARETQDLTERENCDKATSFRTVWKSEMIKRNIPERPQHTIFLKIATPQLRQTISARNYSATPMFRSTRVPYSADKEKSRMHFVSPEWKSEHVSWLRFHKTDLKDIHKLGWI